MQAKQAVRINAPPALTAILEHIASTSVAVGALPLLEASDRWLLASNLQKAIRLGLTDVALATMVKLLQVDEPYLWRRLPVVAYEDVGAGSHERCLEVLQLFRRAALHRRFGSMRVAGYLVRRLCEASKSRALCDAIAALEFSPELSRLEQQVLALNDAQLLAAIAAPTADVTHRVACLRQICGYHRFCGGAWRTVAAPRRDLMEAVCDRMQLSPDEHALFLSGNGVTDSLNIPVPVIAEFLCMQPPVLRTTSTGFAGRHGILYAALDRHTRVGKRCFAALLAESVVLRRYFRAHPGVDPVAALGCAAFVSEGARLDRELIFNGRDLLRQQFEQAFFASVGLRPDAAAELTALLLDEREALNALRAEALA
ncbi:hypothetical protein ABWH74_001933 [Burkholderia vietnamiensis]|uniref:hypothetical protein n=1 Tax=Burkholderia sp. Bp8986 TaxID=2184550 RepID=UPI000F5A1611|nr:hypothetical protein [Burkholderia sp. Bp8986]RQS46891.1 hypothetical protein DID99_31285 [Burkholderia sp. Bp8986]